MKIQTSIIMIQWLDLLDILTPVLTVWLLYKQYRLQQAAEKNNLYNRRMEIYEAIEALLKLNGRNGFVTYEEINLFRQKVNKAEFLFDKKTCDYIDKVRNQAWKGYELQLGMYPKFGPSQLSDDQRKEATEEQGEINKRLNHQLKESKDVFRKYFKLH